MVVEKDSFLRDALVDANHALGFRFVLKAAGLPDAVEKLIKVRVNPDKVGTGGLDLLVTQVSDCYVEGRGLYAGSGRTRTPRTRSCQSLPSAPQSRAQTMSSPWVSARPSLYRPVSPPETLRRTSSNRQKANGIP